MSEAVVAVAVATLWSTPEAPRGVDTPALANPVYSRHWVSALGAADRADLDGRTRTQVPLGEPVTVAETRDGWSRVLVPGQPSTRDPKGYPGWLPTVQLTADNPKGAEYVVDATSTALRDEPDGDVLLPGVVLGTRLFATGAAERGWLPVRVPGLEDVHWARLRDVAALPGDGPTPLAVAARLLDAPYLWGGVSVYGIDCSGLVHLAFARLGLRVPRDAADQLAAAEPVPLDHARPGDLYFFAHHDKPAHHVGFLTEDGLLLHASASAGRVVCEEMSAERAETLLAAGRFTV